ncbi:serine/threonine-protein kinase [Rhodohalobacter sp. 614A]|uniref:serine/threonine-protein kinase n=1 Tax=Rhodohalobacter sp. 614A TaxID=2908649 RepID=UPI001F41ECB0|nr:serine/threonine-protein kinase [Rhodohalobacter sp. 614A]
MKNLTHDRWLQIDTLFKEVLELPSHSRKTFLRDTCGADTELMNHVEKLLQMHDEAEDLLGESAGTFAAPIIPDLLTKMGGYTEESEAPGSTVGPYEILEKIGRGGMGSVYVAKKADAPYDKKVALKLVRRGMDTQDILRRFHHEGKILASLEHANIAQLYDGGVHTDGRPFFVMEYIQGEPIDKYCNKHKLSIRERLELFKTVCEAVHYAHQNLVVHRDIKPANVLVTDDGTIKLVDFGIAKLLQPDEISVTHYHTQTGMRLMTPEFAAPEQIQGKQITTASDIYALGVLLYLLVTGQKPYRIEKNSMLEMERVICETEPIRPSEAVAGEIRSVSQVITEETTDSELNARFGKKDAEDLKKELAGDIDRIVLMALRKEPDRRYRSALGFAEDIENYLQGRPVYARPSTIQYRIQKFIHRNRWAVLASAIAIFAVISGLAIALWQADVARTERDVAQNEAAKAQAAQDYLIQLFEAADPAENRGEQMTAQEIVRNGIARIEADLAGQPEVQTEMYSVLGRVEQALGDFDQSEELLQKALDNTRKLRGENHPDVAAISYLLGDVLRWKGDYDRSETLLREALEMRRHFIQGDDPDIAMNMDRLARTLEMKGDFEEAESLYRQALTMRQKLFGENSDAVAANLNNLGWLLFQMGEIESSEEALRRSLDIREKLVLAPHPDLASTMSNLSVVLRTKGDFKDAEYFSVQALEQERKLYGEDHPRVTTALNNRTLILLELGHYEEAAKNYQQILENNRRQLGPDHLYVGFALSGLSDALIESGRNDEAISFLDEAIDVFRVSVGENHRYYAMGLAFKGKALSEKAPDKAIPFLEQSMDIYEQTVGENHPDLARTLTIYGKALQADGKKDEAESAFKEALEIQRHTISVNHKNTIWTLTNLGQLLTEQDRTDEAEPFLREAVEASEITLPQEHWQRLSAHLVLGECLAAGGQTKAAQEEINHVLDIVRDRTDYHGIRLQNQAKELQKSMAVLSSAN